MPYVVRIPADLLGVTSSVSPELVNVVQAIRDWAHACGARELLFEFNGRVFSIETDCKTFAEEYAKVNSKLFSREIKLIERIQDGKASNT